jgi:hypothetical protein
MSRVESFLKDKNYLEDINEIKYTIEDGIIHDGSTQQ